MGRLLLDIIDDKRKAEGAISVWDRSPANVERGQDYSDHPNINRFIREPRHVEILQPLGQSVFAARPGQPVGHQREQPFRQRLAVAQRGVGLVQAGSHREGVKQVTGHPQRSPRSRPELPRLARDER